MLQVSRGCGACGVSGSLSGGDGSASSGGGGVAGGVVRQEAARSGQSGPSVTAPTAASSSSFVDVVFPFRRFFVAVVDGETATRGAMQHKTRKNRVGYYVKNCLRTITICTKCRQGAKVHFSLREEE
ncbi:hypothetical protein E2C01_036546 [Portunus trituberculatus]|uniref:Uncharacterized protein n=1 Tax=Portunus trituberculatus TaxID=210409 RepID=A0A5B7FCR9_PORTR|nr:hypothetical protein [Portunus trituberculatus]